MSTTEKTYHTPGPWQWHWRLEDGIATGSVFAEPTPGHAYAVAMCPRYQKQEQWEADATLICAAPELLVALQLIQGFNWQLDDSEHGKEIKRRALAAIAKATQP